MMEEKHTHASYLRLLIFMMRSVVSLKRHWLNATPNYVNVHHVMSRSALF